MCMNKFFSNMMKFKLFFFTDVNDVKCYGVYGCFPITPPFTSESRPISVYPFSPQRLDVHFPVFNHKIRNTPEFIDINDPDSIYNLKLNPKGN